MRSRFMFDRDVPPLLATVVAVLGVVGLFSGCSAFDPVMEPYQSHYDEIDREKGYILYELEAKEMRSIGGVVEVRAFNSSIWRKVPADRDWTLWIND